MAPSAPSPAFVVSAASLPSSLCELAVVHWSQLGKVVTVPICSRGSSHPRQSSYICTTQEGGEVPDPRRLGANGTLNDR